MSLLLITTLLVSGLGSLSSSVPRQFHVVKEQKNWTEAQQYCREKFTDLATIDDMTENGKVKSKIHDAGSGNAWMGLKKGKWQWSLVNRDFNRGNEGEFSSWAKNEPGDKNCVLQLEREWFDSLCSEKRSFICYDEGDSAQPYVLVTDKKNWADAQRYCREQHTDLASVRNQTENDQIKDVSGGRRVWIGLFRDAWEWSDGSSSSFRHWKSGEPNYLGGVDWCTVITPSGQWNDESCHKLRNFICYEDLKVVKRQIVKVKFQADSQVNINDPNVQQAILQQIQERLRKSGMPADAKLTWRRQPDEQIFKEEKEKKEEGKKRRKKTEL